MSSNIQKLIYVREAVITKRSFGGCLEMVTETMLTETGPMTREFSFDQLAHF